MVFVLPSKRAGAFLKREISALIDKPVFAPIILSIEEFSEKVSELKTLDSTTTLFEFYSVYKKFTTPEEIEDFEKFSVWAQTLVQDFNEIDRYLIPPEKIFNYLSEIQDINHWSLQAEKTELVKNYLAFWKKLPLFYNELKKVMLQNKTGYQGLVYRLASEKIENYAQKNVAEHIFIGFNALNSAEQKIIQVMIARDSRIYWDLDEDHLNKIGHDASLFIRDYIEQWPYYQSHQLQHISSDYTSEKEIDIIGIPKNVGQAKYVGEILSQLTPEQLNSTAVVLGDESLLLPVLNSMPSNVEALNVTMGYPLRLSPLAILFEDLFKNYEIGNGRFYYKNVLSLLKQPAILKATLGESATAIKKINKENILYISSGEICALFPKERQELIQYCFPSGLLKPEIALLNLEKLIEILRTTSLKDSPLDLEFLYHYDVVLEELKNLILLYPHVKTIPSLHHFFDEICSKKSLDFQGKPFQGLQLMGMLESRVLDFETVILTSANEGVLPAGKSNNSFIPYDLKKNFKLPTYKEKDAVYTYHFYHLLYRAKKVFLLHNSDASGLLGGEKSRFLLQLELDKQPKHHIKNYSVVQKVPVTESELKLVEKKPEMLEKIRQLAERGFSPSALTTYIRNPIDFYRQYILGIKDKEEVEETVAYNTLGTVVHETLESFYKPLEGIELTPDHIRTFETRITTEVTAQFEKTYSKIPLNQGKNLLIFEVVKRYVSNFLKMELRELEGGKKIVIKKIEAQLKAPVDINEIPFPVNIRGNVDRVDMENEVMRIIDYKTGKVVQGQLEIVSWDAISTDYDQFSKPFQVLTYALMLLHNDPSKGPVEAGVISFKNLKEGFLKFAKKESARDRNKNFNIDAETLENFKEQLKNLILEICDPKIPFLEKEIKKGYGNY